MVISTNSRIPENLSNMAANNGKTPELIHGDILRPSSMDNISLCDAVQGRFVDLCNAYARIRGVMLVPPADLDTDLLLWRTMAKRHRIGDFRNSRDEILATRRVAQWTVDVNATLRNQEAKAVAWRD